ncbi:MAG: dihydropteroate synthase [Planctomycetota bacterium]
MTTAPAKPHEHWRLSSTSTLDVREPRVMTILNITPDSFSDGGAHERPDAAASAAILAVQEGADLLDVGAESTRPGAERIPAEAQLARLLPAIRAIRDAGVILPITVDTTLAGVAEACLDAGATAINDVSGGTEDPNLLALAAERRVGIVLMHRLAPPDRDSYSDRYRSAPSYDGGVVASVKDSLARSLERAVKAGIAPEAVLLDPGLGFGKTVEQNLELVRRTGEFLALGRPILSGASRKSFVGRAGATPGQEPDPPAARDAASVAFSVLHFVNGASVFRVHATAMHVRAVRAAHAALPSDRWASR